MSQGIVLFAHGSRVQAANEDVREAARALADAGGFDRVEPAFLELAKPDLAGAVERLIAHGITRVLVIPYFLTGGRHQDQDLPALVSRLENVHPGVEIRIADGLAGHPGITGVLLARAREGLSRWEQD